MARSGERSRGRVLAARFGFNPNSSSLGIDVSFLLLGLSGVAVVSQVVSTFLRGVRPPASDEGEPPG